ncbi:nicotinamidase/pyrazinamidase [Sphingomonas kyeonggiensis]|uniref:cysteine hydrolase family protein n=1 Tax=Sphingomonas kyeonggiensis TaxID=1268553 RepID=UPI00277E4591|nr:isochorismatase family cysteine hydrolase [Sphingomonas kyeonggiensis]MDQ0251803.1 nicotinamidase/pyrazinamidase [Sphingomonas kyeonggiensis]
MSSFVIVVDMQRDFVAADGALPVADAERIVAPMRGWLAGLRPDAVAGVLFTFDTHVPLVYAVSEEAKQFPPHCEKGGPGWELVVDPGAVDPAIATWRLEKGVFDMWAEPGLRIESIRGEGSVEREAFFSGLFRGEIDEVIVVGVAADYCVRWAVEGLIERGFRVTVPAGLTRGIARPIDQVAAEEWAGADVAIAEMA